MSFINDALRKVQNQRNETTENQDMNSSSNNSNDQNPFKPNPSDQENVNPFMPKGPSELQKKNAEKQQENPPEPKEDKPNIFMETGPSEMQKKQAERIHQEEQQRKEQTEKNTPQKKKTVNPFLIFGLLVIIGIAAILGICIMKPSLIPPQIQQTEFVRNWLRQREQSKRIAMSKGYSPSQFKFSSQKGLTNNENIGFTVSGIMMAGTNYIALIDEDVYEEGRVINGWTIKSIDSKNVLIERNGETKTLSITR